ncbi:MAG TPA: DMT family transporter [Candidatus Limnocylindria bacterium]|nr:DMT family transporter [Candidatus Limnocylindria bacterium]
MTATARPRRDLVGVAMVLGAAASFGTLGPLSEFAHRGGVSSLTFAAWRVALGAVCVAGVLLAARAAGRPVGLVPLGRVTGNDRLWVAAAAIVNAFLNLAVFLAFERVGIVLSLLMFYLYPAWVALASVAWFGERLDRVRWGALAMSLAGSVLVVAGAGNIGSLDALGIGLAFLGGIGQTFYVLTARHGFAGIPGAQAAVMTMTGATLVYVVIALVFTGLATLAEPLRSMTALWPVLLTGVIGAGVPTFLYITGIRRLGAPTASILATFEPVVGVALAAWLLSERPAVAQLLGGLLIIAAGILLQLRPNAEAADHEVMEAEARQADSA